MVFVKNDSVLSIVVESCAYEGVKRIAEKVATDVEKVCDVLPQVIDIGCEYNVNAVYSNFGNNNEYILAVTLGNSPIIDNLIEKGLFDAEEIQGKREVYKIQLLKKPWEGADEVLVICGSDKRGTIYGLFSFSEYIGVSPLCFFGDVKPLKRSAGSIMIDEGIERVSKEPSVKYRGFFINDEWPCFGNWVSSHFGGFNAKMYDHVFELLLRLKGNYLWPAMWTSSFPLDGPGSLNEELADLYGIIIGNSHHEPCLRASEEWDKVRGKDSIYGNEWNYYTNKDGLTKYWEDALIRSGKYEKMITIGMRGERDSSMLGQDATLKENIDLLKDIIITQKNLISRHVNADISKVPMLLALYKEVEEYFYGDEDTKGLKDWEGISNVICMLCEDNFGFLRTLPTEELRKKIEEMNGGFGMYYHFDYHGGPISYEWMPSVPFSKIWEQMCMAYEYGIRDVWIVNVGDLKFNEVLLSYFMTLAYDFDTWGSSAVNSWKTYTKSWLNETFPDVAEELKSRIGDVFTGFIDINAMRRPESLNSSIYHPCNYLETDRMLALADEIERMNEKIYKSLIKTNEYKDAYYSMVYYPAKASLNLLRMHLYAGKNEHYAKQGKKIANVYSDKVTECILEDRRLLEEFAAFNHGKWKGMELAQHIGFVTWNDFNNRYPIRMQVEPANKPRMVVSRKDDERIANKTYGRPMTIIADDFLYAGQEEVILEIANDGIGEFEYNIVVDSINGKAVPKEVSDKNQSSISWLNISKTYGRVKDQVEVVLRCDRTKLTKEITRVELLISGAETKVLVIVSGKAVDTSDIPPMTFFDTHGVIAIEANHYFSCHDTIRGRFMELDGYGRSGHGMKVFPSTVNFLVNEEKPSLTYQFLIPESGIYVMEAYLTPTNSVVSRRELRFMLSDSGGGKQIVTVLPADFKAGDSREVRWSRGVLNQIRTVKAEVEFEKGIQSITIGALEAGLVLERVLIYHRECTLKPSYLGPKESTTL